MTTISKISKIDHIFNTVSLLINEFPNTAIEENVKEVMYHTLSVLSYTNIEMLVTDTASYIPIAALKVYLKYLCRDQHTKVKLIITYTNIERTSYRIWQAYERDYDVEFIVPVWTTSDQSMQDLIDKVYNMKNETRITLLLKRVSNSSSTIQDTEEDNKRLLELLKVIRSNKDLTRKALVDVDSCLDIYPECKYSIYIMPDGKLQRCPYSLPIIGNNKQQENI